jgi:hypothetical protein
MTEQPYDSINRDNLDSPELGTCDKCGLDLASDDTIVEAHWHRYEGSNQSSGNGWVRWCSDCIPPGIPKPK